MIYPVSENSPDLYIHVLVTTFERSVSANIDIHPSRYTKKKKKKVNQAKLEFSCICYGTTFSSVG